jgi:hypothetical protein
MHERGHRRDMGAIRYYAKPGWDRIIPLDYPWGKRMPSGTCPAILKAAGIAMGRKT